MLANASYRRVKRGEEFVAGLHTVYDRQYDRDVHRYIKPCIDIATVAQLVALQPVIAARSTVPLNTAVWIYWCTLHGTTSSHFSAELRREALYDCTM